MENYTNIANFIAKYEKFYFSSANENEKREYGLKGLHSTCEKTEKMVMQFLSSGSVNESVIAWKAGRLNCNGSIQKADNGTDYLNGYGRIINAEALENYLKSFSEDRKKYIIDLSNKGDIKGAYELTRKGCPKNFGTVYIINLMFFITKGTLPIYDQFAHKALRALIEDEVPSNIYIGAAPEKDEFDHIMIMYSEYIRLINRAFGKDQIQKDVNNRGYENKNMLISRELDRALWVYGHANCKYILKQ